ncbi:MAG: tRNA pseudouridine(38-40) synthase TruA [Desulfobacula sp. RIFOXYB2_FULL_45_6]|nr:MAG: tRNA pseudouridine(38-40) synthase TruA [Desulfobacula sp. RIFOXYB2_FULL_45_6]
MSKNFKIVVEYDGTHFFGWQRQKDQKTVQCEIEKILSRIMNQKIRITGSGRTDSGVHAFGQVANFHADTDMKPNMVQKALNGMIKDPIVIRECSLVDDDFHAQYDAISKEYRYYILNREDPCAIGASFQWHIRQPLDMELMGQCCHAIIGVFDFRSFENSGSPRSSTIREIFFSDICQLNHNRLVFKICASGFLKYMVRNLIGTIVLAGQKKISVEEFKAILHAKDRTKAGPTAPPHGLFLKQVNYF